MMYRHTILFLLFALCAWGPAQGQPGPSSLWGIGTGGGTSAVGSRTAALYANPSYLTTGPSPSPFETRVMELRVSAGGSLLQFDHYQALFGGSSRTDTEEEQVLRKWFDGERRQAATQLEIIPVTIVYNPPGKRWAVGAALRARSRVQMEMDRGLLDLLLIGADTPRTVPLNGRYRTSVLYDLTGSVSYAFDSVPLSVGVSPRLIVGTDYADSRFDSEVIVGETSLVHRFDYAARAAGALSRHVYDSFNAFSANPLQHISAAGTGRGIAGVGGAVDLGATYEVVPGFFASASVTDLGWVTWSADAQTVIPQRNEFRFEGLELDLERIQNEYDGSARDYFEQQVDSLARAAYQEVRRDRSSFSTAEPAALHLGGTWANPGDRPLMLTGGATLSTEIGAPAFYVGAERPLGPVPLRLGVRIGGSGALTFAGGIGLAIGGYRFDLGARLTPSTSTLGSGGRYAVGLSMATF